MRLRTLLLSAATVVSMVSVPSIAAAVPQDTGLFDYQEVFSFSPTLTLYAQNNQTSATDATGSLSTSALGLNAAGSGESVIGANGITFHATSSLSGIYTGSSTNDLNSESFAGLSGTYVISSPGQTGNGQILVRLGYDGTIGGTTSGGNVTAGALGQICSGLAFNSACLGTTKSGIFDEVTLGSGPSSTTANGTAIIGAINFTYNVPFDFSVYLATTASVSNALSGTSVNAFSDFSDTATLLPIQVFNSAGQLDTNAIIQSTTDPSVHLTTAVPEPATWAMMLLGVLGVGAALRTRRRGVRMPGALAV